MCTPSILYESDMRSKGNNINTKRPGFTGNFSTGGVWETYYWNILDLDT